MACRISARARLSDACAEATTGRINRMVANRSGKLRLIITKLRPQWADLPVRLQEHPLSAGPVNESILGLGSQRTKLPFVSTSFNSTRRLAWRPVSLELLSMGRRLP